MFELKQCSTPIVERSKQLAQSNAPVEPTPRIAIDSDVIDSPVIDSPAIDSPVIDNRLNNNDAKSFAKKQVFKILRHLKDDIERKKTEVKTPSTWMLKQLIKNAGFAQRPPPPTQRAVNWHESTLLMLQVLEIELKQPNNYPKMVEDDGVSPLFSSENDYSPKEALRFVRCAKRYFIYSMGKSRKI